MDFDNIRPNYYLSRWQYYEKARHDLTPTELKHAKVFFNALKNLDRDSLAVLTDVFYFSKDYTSTNERGYYQTVRAVPNGFLAKKYGVSSNKFGDMRREAQFKLRIEMKKIMKQISEHFKLRMNIHVYFLHTFPGTYSSPKYVVGSEYEAKVFHRSEYKGEEVTALMRIGFEYIPI